MENTAFLIGVIGVAILLVIISGIIAFRLNKKITTSIYENSQRYKKICSLNRQYEFYPLKRTYYYNSNHFKTKAQFDRFHLDVFFNKIIEENLEFFEQILDQAWQNKALYQKYQERIKKLPGLTTREQLKIQRAPYWLYKKKELKLCQKEIQRPVTQPTVICEARYTSPKGRSSHEKAQTFTLEQISYGIEQAKQEQQRRETKEFQRRKERGKMSPSLRYNILKRDNFRCVLCGRSAQDGVKLHVDHIVPISKGGKTIPDNLRTLCEQCNVGKGSKIEKDTSDVEV